MFVGCLLWVVNWIRSDVLYVVFTVLQFLVNSGEAYSVVAKRVFYYFKGILSLGIKYEAVMLSLQFISFSVWSDSDWVADKDIRRSVSVFYI